MECIKSIIEWLNANTGFVMILLTFVMALLTLVYVGFTYCLVSSAKKANQVALDLHKEIYRPMVICDFFSENTCLYFRVKNLGNSPAKNVRVEIDGPSPCLLSSWEDHPIVQEGISFLPQGAEVVCLFAGPTDEEKLKTLAFDLKYEDRDGQGFSDHYSINLEARLHEDIGRKNNDPVVQAIQELTKTIEKKLEN